MHNLDEMKGKCPTTHLGGNQGHIGTARLPCVWMRWLLASLLNDHFFSKFKSLFSRTFIRSSMSTMVPFLLGTAYLIFSLLALEILNRIAVRFEFTPAISYRYWGPSVVDRLRFFFLWCSHFMFFIIITIILFNRSFNWGVIGKKVLVCLFL